MNSILAGILLRRAGRTLSEVQCHLNNEGASELVAQLIIRSQESPSVFAESVALGIALLEGGNPVIQASLKRKLMEGDISQSFFKVISLGCIS